MLALETVKFTNSHVKPWNFIILIYYSFLLYTSASDDDDNDDDELFLWYGWAMKGF